MHDLVDVLGAIVTVALVTTLVSHPQTSSVVNAFGNAFSHSLLAAQGQRV